MPKNKGATAAGFADPDDAPDLSAPEWAAKIDAAKVQRGRPKSAQPKVSTTIRLDADVIAFFRKRGRGWQTEINAALRKAIKPLKKRAG